MVRKYSNENEKIPSIKIFLSILDKSKCIGYF